MLLVLAFHVWQIGDPNVFLRSGWQRLIAGGWCGVDLFLVLSGFLITGVLYDSKQSPHYFRSFYMRRLLRIFPLYYGFLAFFFFVLPLFATMGEQYAALSHRQMWLWLYAQNHYTIRHIDGLPCGMGHFWSLAVEEQFYIVWPVLIWRFSRRGLLRICLLILLAGITSRTALTLWGVHPYIIYPLTTSRMDGLAMGAVVALLLRSERGSARLVCWAKPVALFSLALLGALAYRHHGVLVWHSRLVQTVGFSILALFFASVITLAVTGQPRHLARRFFSFGILRWLGKYSYGIYVIHWPIFGSVGLWYPRLGRTFDALLGREVSARLLQTPVSAAVITTLLSLTGAFLSWHLYEKHFLKLKHFFPRQKGCPASSVPMSVPQSQIPNPNAPTIAA